MGSLSSSHPEPWWRISVKPGPPGLNSPMRVGRWSDSEGRCSDGGEWIRLPWERTQVWASDPACIWGVNSARLVSVVRGH